MDPQDFTCPAAGRAVKAETGYWAFVPAPLPPPIQYDAPTTLLLSQADAALSELSGLGRYLPNPDLLIAPYVKREAVASSRIEGTQADLSDLLLDEIEPKWTPPGSDVLEVRNYVAALNRGIRDLEKLPLSCRLVRDIHAVLMAGVRGHDKTPGEFRRSQNWIGSPGCTLADATYVPPPEHEMKECLTLWERFLHQRDTMPELIQCALIHEHFEAIHPFLDGNGRIGRLLITLFLIERGRLSSRYCTCPATRAAPRTITTPCFNASAPWRLARLVPLFPRRRARHRPQRDRPEPGHPQPARHLPPATSQASTAPSRWSMNCSSTPIPPSRAPPSTWGVTAPTASKTIRELERASILKEVTGREWGRFWLAEPILKALAASPVPAPPTGGQP
jgi:Fic family protein